MSVHLCHAENCTAPVPPEKLMCFKHWKMVPPEIQHLVLDTYRHGQCVDKMPSRLWQHAAKAAVRFVALAEGYRSLPATLLRPR